MVTGSWIVAHGGGRVERAADGKPMGYNGELYTGGRQRMPLDGVMAEGASSKPLSMNVLKRS
jgi:hypothetical protein